MANNTNTPESKSLALFDFDGTITCKDSFLKFLCFNFSAVKLITGTIFLLPALAKYKLGFLTNEQAKQAVFACFFSGWETKKFEKTAHKFSLTILPTIVKESALEKIRWHKKQGHEVVIVSASFETYLRPWCNENNLVLIGTQLEEKQGYLTGYFSSPNCHGKEKVTRIKEKYNLNQFNCIYAYGDSSGDREMLQIANKPHYRSFK